MTDQTEVVEVNALYLTPTELEAGLDHVRQSPKDEGELVYIVVRPQPEERLVLTECEMSPQQGVHDDGWLHKGNPSPDRQITLMNVRCTALLARTRERWALAGDQLYVDLDLSVDNLKPGQWLAIGSVILEVTEPPHTGCAKFAQRYGKEALKIVNSPEGRQLHLRGIYARVIQAGTAKVGDRIMKC